MRVVYHWAAGAFVNTLDDQFDEAYKELCEYFGFPTIARVMADDDWDTWVFNPETGKTERVEDTDASHLCKRGHTPHRC